VEQKILKFKTYFRQRFSICDVCWLYNITRSAVQSASMGVASATERNRIFCISRGEARARAQRPEGLARVAYCLFSPINF